jgi:uncharacterized protein YunC (DUF1805 family)
MSNLTPAELPRITQRELQFAGGTAIGLAQRWAGGQCCAIQTAAGIVGCGIYDLATAAEFGHAIAIARGTPANPLVEPEDLLDAKIVGCTPQASALGVRPGITGREAVERMLAPRGQVASDNQAHSVDKLRPHALPPEAPI